MTKFVKIENKNYPEYIKYDYIVEETKTQYKCSERKLNKDFTIQGTSLTWRFLNPEEENSFIQDMRTIPIITDINLIEDIRLMSYSISREDLCSSGRDLWYIVERYISEILKALNVEERFFCFWYGGYYLATRLEKYNIDFNFEPISKELWEIIQDKEFV